MKPLHPIKISCSLFMALVMTDLPAFALTDHLIEAKSPMISTSAALNEISRADAEAEVTAYLGKTEVQAELIRQGLSPGEVSARLASLSEQEMRQLSGQVREARAGGDILVTILLILLIIYFFRRV